MATRGPGSGAPPAVILVQAGGALRRRREHAGLTITEVARKAGLSARFVSMVERGLGNISLVRFERLAGAIGATPAALLAADQPPPTTQRHVALLGLRGAGKSTLGARAAAATRRRFVELDRVVEDRAGMPLPEIFAVHGEPYYRKLEREALEVELRADEPAVIATGGGIVASDATFDLLRRACTTVWLRATPRQHWERVQAQGDRRPMESRPNAMSELRAILAERTPRYRTADHTIDTSRGSEQRATDALVRILRRDVPRPKAARRSSRSDRRQPES